MMMVSLTTEMTSTMFVVMELANSIASWPTTTPNPHAAALANVRSLYTRLRQAADSAQPNVDLTEEEVGIIGGCCDIALMMLKVTGSPVIPGTTVSRSQIADLRRSMMTVLQSRNVMIRAN